MPNSVDRTDIEDRLAGCFAAVFPDLPPERIRQASHEQVEAWDSLAALTLVDLIEEELGVAIDLEDAVELTSFQAIADRIASELE